jgi:hypothetical protein
MDLDKLKSTWEKVSTETQKRDMLPEEEFRKILNKKTLDISAKIRRNIKIGLSIVIIWVLASITLNYIATPLLDKFFNSQSQKSDFILITFILDFCIYAFIIISIILFWRRYNSIEKSNKPISSLHDRILRKLEILNSYRKMFYIFLIIVLVYVFAAFTTGFLLGYQHEAEATNFALSKLDPAALIIILLAYILSAGIILLIYYFFFNLFFKRLYGRYIIQLKETLAELNENGQAPEK